MKLELIKKNINKILYSLLFAVVALIFIVQFVESYFEIPGDKWAYKELFINYSGGMIRRGLLGSIFLKLNNNIGIEPLHFYSTFFVLGYSISLFFYYKLLKKFQNFHLIYIFILFSPALILFNIYDTNTYLTKDIFSNLTILLHCYYINKEKNNFKIYKYNNFLLFLLIPFLSINILNHEIQFFFIGIHLLLSSYVYRSYGIPKKDQKNFYYIITLVPLAIILFSPGSWDKVEIINNSVKIFDVSVNDQLAGNINLALGGFIKWHFIYHGIHSFIKLFLCIILSLFIFYVFFQYLISKNILIIKNHFKFRYYYYYLPIIFIFLLAVDHGRNINLLLTHMVSFFLVLDLNENKLKSFYYKLNKNLILKNILISFLFFYIFLWYLPQGGGYGGVGQFNDGSSILKNTLFNEIKNIFMIVYDFVDSRIINLPRVIV